YTAQTLLRARELHVRVDLIDRLPTPFGLVRPGVAPDHQGIKRVSRQFARVASDQRVRFFGNVEVGRDVSVEELRERYDALVIATGASAGRTLGVPGEDIAGVTTAADFVFWYNGHPDHSARDYDLAHVRRAVVIGNGNVALDVARVLTLPAPTLQGTDIADPALARLVDRGFDEIHVLGRRGPAQASFTPPEIRELGNHAGIALHIDPADLELDPASRALHDRAGTPPRSEKLLRALKAVPQAHPDADRAIHLRFRIGVQAFLADDAGRLRAVRLVHNELVEEDGQLLAQPVSESWEEPCQLAVTAVGYRGVPLAGLPFDDARGIVPSLDGRVLEPGGQRCLSGLYVTGWARRGARGVVGTNKPDGAGVASAILDDLAGKPSTTEPRDDLSVLLADRSVRVVDWASWMRIDAQETASGVAAGRPRVKRTSWAALLEAAGAPDRATQADVSATPRD
ncbi:MAG: FAD-dependent oxidoreductase, partial [Myxococcota bacterium]|nr:FAD-dependent oxidoreductase [Myxococcota bacterium]